MEKFARLWPEVIKGIGWEVRDGRSVKFWEDRWLNGVDKLGNYFVGELGMLNPTLTVSQTLNIEGNLNWAWLEGVLPQEVTQLLKAIPPPCPEDGDNIVVWRGGHGARFSVSQMYQQLRGDVNMELGAIWKVKPQEGFRYFCGWQHMIGFSQLLEEHVYWEVRLLAVGVVEELKTLTMY
ncbi:hypothetical protein K1719_042301 [Acacia pycnantha]|nr:hypothetical protein K1719_042301 [Acacia pycnantha]